MAETRSTFLAATEAARPVVALPEASLRWEEPSALREMTVGALVAHLVRAVTNVERGLAAPVPEGVEPITAAVYFVDVNADLASANNVRVRATSDEEALVGHRATLGRMDRGLERLRGRLESEPADRLVTLRDGEVLLLDEYLKSRILEITVHTDDLCVSLGRETPVLPGLEISTTLLLHVAALRHGDLAVLRALARRERDRDEVLRVI